jgi:hypothetical protein
MRRCSSCGCEVLPEDSFCANCGTRFDPTQAQASPEAGPRAAMATAVADQPAAAVTTGFRNPAVEAVAAQLDQATQPPQVAQAPRNTPIAPEPPPRVYRKPPLTIGGWSFFDKVRFRWGGGGAIILGISLIGGGHSAGAAIFGVLFIGLGIATWVLTGFGSRGREEWGDDWYSAWNSMSTNGRVFAGTGSVIGVLFVYLLFFWFFIIRWFIKNIIT